MAAAFIPVAEYLHSVYEPECEYVDGILVERNVGEYDHSRLEATTGARLYAQEKELDLRVLIAQRMRITPTRYRVPDVCVTGRQREPVLIRPPLLCIEILSPEDRMSRVMERVKDFLDFGVRYVWIIDPIGRKAHECAPGIVRDVPDGILRTEQPELVLNVNDLFRDLDEA